jgi:hypothetical protein
MAKQEADAGDTTHTDYEPNFVMPRHDAIREDNWPEYEAKGFAPTSGSLYFAQTLAGVGNVYTGDKYDEKTGRPLRHKPGKTIYLSPEGVERLERQLVEDARRLQELREHGSNSDQPPTPTDQTPSR